MARPFESEYVPLRFPSELSYLYEGSIMLRDILMAKTTKQGLFMDIGLDSGSIIGSLQTANELMGEKWGWWSPN